MLSIPPAKTTCALPNWICSIPIKMAFNPEPQTSLIVDAGMSTERPLCRATCRAGFWPLPACRTLPMIT